MTWHNYSSSHVYSLHDKKTKLVIYPDKTITVSDIDIDQVDLSYWQDYSYKYIKYFGHFTKEASRLIVNIKKKR